MDINIVDMVLGSSMALGVWWIRYQHAELRRVTILLNRTREELAREYVSIHRQETDVGRVIDRLDRLEAKLDKLFEAK
jgi:hypothetical protein